MPPKNKTRDCTKWHPVVYYSDCDEDGNCPHCKIDYVECGCVGPTEEDAEYRTIKGVLHGRRLKPVDGS